MHTVMEVDLADRLWERSGEAWLEEDGFVLATGVTLYVKHLEALAVKVQEVGRDSEAARYQRDAAALTAELIGEGHEAGRLFQDRPCVLPGHLTPIGKGLEFYLKNLRAAKGTLRGLGKGPLADTFETEAKGIETRLLPLFEDQQTLPLATAEPVGDLKAIAAQSVEREENGDGPAPTPPPKRRRRKAD
jgi:hypothetical protein